MAAVVEAEASPPGTGSLAAIWLTKLLSVMKKLTSRLNINSNKASPLLPISVSTPPTVTPATSQQQAHINDLHPITQMMREQELGRVIITLAVPVAAALLVSGSNGELLVAHVVAVGLMMGCMAVWNGILFRTNFPRLANILEQVGISLAVVSLYALVASFLPRGFSWILWLSGAFCLTPLIISLL